MEFKRNGACINVVDYPGFQCLNANIFTSGTYYTVNNKGELDGNVFDDVRFTKEVRRANIELMGGITKKITYPLWIYCSAGTGYSPVFWEMNEYTDSGDFYATEWVKNTDLTKFNLIVEPGVMIDLSGLTLRLGVKTYDFKTPTMTFGVGFSTR